MDCEGSHPGHPATGPAREARIREVAYDIFQRTGCTDDVANWFVAVVRVQVVCLSFAAARGAAAGPGTPNKPWRVCSSPNPPPPPHPHPHTTVPLRMRAVEFVNGSPTPSPTESLAPSPGAQARPRPPGPAPARPGGPFTGKLAATGSGTRWACSACTYLNANARPLHARLTCGLCLEPGPPVPPGPPCQWRRCPVPGCKRDGLVTPMALLFHVTAKHPGCHCRVPGCGLVRLSLFKLCSHVCMYVCVGSLLSCVVCLYRTGRCSPPRRPPAPMSVHTQRMWSARGVGSASPGPARGRLERGKSTGTRGACSVVPRGPARPLARPLRLSPVTVVAPPHGNRPPGPGQKRQGLTAPPLLPVGTVCEHGSRKDGGSGGSVVSGGAVPENRRQGVCLEVGLCVVFAPTHVTTARVVCTVAPQVRGLSASSSLAGQFLRR